MKKLFVVCLSGVLVCLVFGVFAQATIIETGDDDWWLGLESGQSFTCVAHYVWGGVEFTQAPVINEIYYDPDNTIWDFWDSEISLDNTIVYLNGPQVTNTSGSSTPILNYQLYYQWDLDLVDPDYPVYVDTAIYDGLLGSEPVAYWGWRGIPGDPNSWEYRETPYVQDEEWYEEGFFANPAPEVTTLSLLGFGALFLRK
ncbi:MAG: hypothetical protein ACYSXD_02920, partial [Planctomycetota bacterium]